MPCLKSVNIDPKDRANAEAQPLHARFSVDFVGATMGLESLPFAAVHESLPWHETDMPTALRDVRAQEQSGKHLPQ